VALARTDSEDSTVGAVAKLVVVVVPPMFARRWAANRPRSPRACSSRRAVVVVVTGEEAAPVGQAEMREQAVALAKKTPPAANPSSRTEVAAQAQKLLADPPEKGSMKVSHRKRAA